MYNVLVTGGTGTLGQAIVRELLGLDVRTIRIFSRNEYFQHKMSQDFDTERLRFMIGDVRDKDRLSMVLRDVDTVFHCAALKHVPICEYNPIEAVRTNVMGAVSLVEATITSGADRVLAVSSDKAVQPINLYGATKLVMEKLIIHANAYGKTKFSCVRLGNIPGSSGSVLETWQKQKCDGVLTITDADMTRYWIDASKAARFCIDSVGRMNGGEIYVPKMFSMRIADLAHEVIGDITQTEIGKRKGEKLHEELFNEGEYPIEFKDYYVIHS